MDAPRAEALRRPLTASDNSLTSPLHLGGPVRHEHLRLATEQAARPHGARPVLELRVGLQMAAARVAVAHTVHRPEEEAAAAAQRHASQVAVALDT